MFIERFSNYLQYEKRFSAHTLRAYIEDIHQFSSFLSLSEQDIISASHNDIRSWVVQLMEDKVKASSINRKLSTLRTFYNMLLREKVIEVNPAALIKAPKVAKVLPVALRESSLSTLLDSEIAFSDDFEGERDKLILELLFGTGIRLAELLTLKESDVEFYSKQIKVLGKRNKERIIPITPGLLNLIDNYLVKKKQQENRKLSSVLIVTRDGKPAYSKLIYRVVNKYLSFITTNPKKSPHVLRHTFATSLLNRGADLNAIKELLGHASLAATQIYTGNSIERLKSIYKQAHPKA